VAADDLIVRLDHDAVDVANCSMEADLRRSGTAMPLGIARICGQVGDLADLIRDNGSTSYPLELLCHYVLRCSEG
jgi:hypothetical protein